MFVVCFLVGHIFVSEWSEFMVNMQNKEGDDVKISVRDEYEGCYVYEEIKMGFV